MRASCVCCGRATPGGSGAEGQHCLLQRRTSVWQGTRHSQQCKLSPQAHVRLQGKADGRQVRLSP